MIIRIFLLLFLSFCFSLYGQDNRISYNPNGLIYKNISTFYERVISDKFTASLGVGYRIPSYLGGKLGNSLVEKISINDSNLEMDKVKGFSLTPQLKIFPARKRGRGFYLGPYYRYSRYTTSFEFLVKDEVQNSYMLNLDVKYKTSGIGLQMGTEWLINDKFMIDFFFFGPRYDYKTIRLDLSAETDADLTALAEQYIDDLNTNSIGFKIADRIIKKAASNGLGTNIPFGIWNYRLGVSFGYAF